MNFLKRTLPGAAVLLPFLLFGCSHSQDPLIGVAETALTANGYHFDPAHIGKQASPYAVHSDTSHVLVVIPYRRNVSLKNVASATDVDVFLVKSGGMWRAAIHPSRAGSLTAMTDGNLSTDGNLNGENPLLTVAKATARLSIMECAFSLTSYSFSFSENDISILIETWREGDITSIEM